MYHNIHCRNIIINDAMLNEHTALRCPGGLLRTRKKSAFSPNKRHDTQFSKFAVTSTRVTRLIRVARVLMRAAADFYCLSVSGNPQNTTYHVTYIGIYLGQRAMPCFACIHYFELYYNLVSEFHDS